MRIIDAHGEHAYAVCICFSSKDGAMHEIYDTGAPKKPTNLSVNSDLLRKAREYGLNLSAVMEAALVEQVRKSERERWLQENREAIDAYNEDVERNGVFSDDLRSF